VSPNKTGRGHAPRVGGQKSKGTIQKGVKLSVETWAALIAKNGKDFSFSDYVRKLIETDLKK
jgi:hypothetical protein